MTSTIDAVILAGGKTKDGMRALTGQENRALVALGAHTMLDWVTAALADSQGLGKLVVIGDVPPDTRYEVIAPGASLVDNLFAGIEAVGIDRPMLAVSSDIPFLTGRAVDDFVSRATQTGADFCYPIIPMARCREQFPQFRRTTLRLREGTFTGGNIMLLNPRVILQFRDTIQAAYGARKSPLALGRMLGWGLAAKILLSQLPGPVQITVPELERGVSRLLGCRCAAVVTEFAEIGTDVDKPDDVTAAQAFLRK